MHRCGGVGWGGVGRNGEDKDRRQRELIERKQIRRDTKASLMDVIALCETVAVMVFLPRWLLFYGGKKCGVTQACRRQIKTIQPETPEMHLHHNVRTAAAAQDRFVQIKARQ